MTAPSRLSIVLPAYNEEMRLPDTLEGLIRSGVPFHEVWVVNDGSIDGTVQIVKNFQARISNLQLISFKSNFGKGRAVREGIRRSNGDLVLIADADMATPWKELFKLLGRLETSDIVIGSRALADSQMVEKESLIRRILGRAFNFCVRWILSLPFQDTQCGFKLLKKESVRAVIDSLEVDRYCWDVEFLVFAQKMGLRISEVPVEWKHHSQSHVRILSDGFTMFLDLIRIRFRAKNWNRPKKEEFKEAA